MMRSGRRTTAAATMAVCAMAAALAACSDDDSSPMVDAGGLRDALDDAPALGVDAAQCDVGDPPGTLPTLTATFVFVDPDAGVDVPAPAGGDVTGGFVVERATFYVPESARGSIDVGASHAEGTAWSVVEGSQYRFAFDLDVTLETTVVGTVRRHQLDASRGTFVASGGILSLTPDEGCAVTTDITEIGYSIDAEGGMLIVSLPPFMGGSAVVVFEGRRVP